MIIEKCKESIVLLLNERERDIQLSSSVGNENNYLFENRELYHNAYKDGYLDLLEDIRNLIQDCNYLEESLR